jgi:hypothetical protein
MINKEQNNGNGITVSIREVVMAKQSVWSTLRLGSLLKMLYGVCGKTGWLDKAKQFDLPLHRDKPWQPGW